MLTEAQRQTLDSLIGERLEELQAAVQQREQAGETVELDQTRQGRLSRMDALQQQAMAQAQGQRAQAQILALRRAQARLDDEDFGLCQDCDAPIAWARLQYNPAVRRCVACAEAAE